MIAYDTVAGTRRGESPAAPGAAETSPERRDELAAARDATAEVRDRLAARLDRIMLTGQVGVDGILARAEDARRAAALDRRAAARDRAAAARDRADAAMRA